MSFAGRTHSGELGVPQPLATGEYRPPAAPADLRFRGIIAAYLVGLGFLGLVLGAGYNNTWDWCKNFTADINNVAWAAAGATYVGFMLLGFLRPRAEKEKSKESFWASCTNNQRLFIGLVTTLAIALIVVGCATPGSDKVWNRFVEWMNYATPINQIAVFITALILSGLTVKWFEANRGKDEPRLDTLPEKTTYVDIDGARLSDASLQQ